MFHRKKYAEYSVNVDPAQDDKASEIKLCSFARPHMRAFHFAWWGFFTAFFIWCAIAPLLVEIQKSLGLTKQQVWTSNIVGVTGTVCMQFLLGKQVGEDFSLVDPFSITSSLTDSVLFNLIQVLSMTNTALASCLPSYSVSLPFRPPW